MRIFQVRYGNETIIFRCIWFQNWSSKTYGNYDTITRSFQTSFSNTGRTIFHPKKLEMWKKNERQSKLTPVRIFWLLYYVLWWEFTAFEYESTSISQQFLLGLLSLLCMISKRTSLSIDFHFTFDILVWVLLYITNLSLNIGTEFVSSLHHKLHKKIS